MLVGELMWTAVYTSTASALGSKMHLNSQSDVCHSPSRDHKMILTIRIYITLFYCISFGFICIVTFVSNL